MRPLALASMVLAMTSPAFADTAVYVSLAGDKKIALYRMGDDGKLTHQADTAIEGEPGALTTDPQRKFLFASVRSTGNLAAFRIDPKTGKLTHVNTVPAGADPSYVATDRTGRFLLAAYYRAGKVTVHAVGKDGSLSEKPLQTVETAPTAHSSVPDPSNRFVFVPHPAPNAVFQFTFDAKTGKLAPNAVPKLQMEKNTGPRHLVFHPKQATVVYFDNEQGSSVTACTFDPTAGTLKPFQTVPTLPKDFTRPNSTAEVKVHPSGKFVYCSNRGHDSIAMFSVSGEDGKLAVVGQAPTERTPRSFEIDPTGSFLYAAGEDSGKVAAYRIDPKTGELKRFETYEVGKTPWWVMAVPLPGES